MPAAHLLERDHARVWHPYASTKSPGPLYVVEAAFGDRLMLHDGTQRVECIDAMASWWCQIHGYRHPRLDAPIVEQVGRFSHVMFGGLTHEPGVRLAEELAALAPAPLERVFLADSGSVAVEVALKIARQAQAGRPGRTLIAALRGGYHGDTLGAMSVCDPVGGMHSLFADAIPRQVFLPRPPAYQASADAVAAWAAQAEATLRAHRDELAGVIVEPILQGAGGMWPWSPACLAALRRWCDELELVLIADEIATGFGRTGCLFACEQADVVPDILVVGKALTGGYCTQAAVITTERLASKVSDGPGGALMHGPTFMANPLASAVSLASIGLINTGDWRDDVPRIGRVLGSALEPLRGRASVADVRVLGATAAIELAVPLDVRLATETAIEHGVWLRPFRNLVYAMPPYITPDEDLRRIADAMAAVVVALEERA